MNLLHKGVLPLFICPMITLAGTAKPLADINWNANLEQIKKIHKIKPEEELKNRLTYETHLFDMAFHQEYVFNDKGKCNNSIIRGSSLNYQFIKKSADLF